MLDADWHGNSDEEYLVELFSTVYNDSKDPEEIIRLFCQIPRLFTSKRYPLSRRPDDEEYRFDKSSRGFLMLHLLGELKKTITDSNFEARCLGFLIKEGLLWSAKSLYLFDSFSFISTLNGLSRSEFTHALTHKEFWHSFTTNDILPFYGVLSSDQSILNNVERRRQLMEAFFAQDDRARLLRMNIWFAGDNHESADSIVLDFLERALSDEAIARKLLDHNIDCQRLNLFKCFYAQPSRNAANRERVSRLVVMVAERYVNTIDIDDSLVIAMSQHNPCIVRGEVARRVYVVERIDPAPNTAFRDRCTTSLVSEYHILRSLEWKEFARYFPVARGRQLEYDREIIDHMTSQVVEPSFFCGFFHGKFDAYKGYHESKISRRSKPPLTLNFLAAALQCPEFQAYLFEPVAGTVEATSRESYRFKQFLDRIKDAGRNSSSPLVMTQKEIALRAQAFMIAFTQEAFWTSYFPSVQLPRSIGAYVNYFATEQCAKAFLNVALEREDFWINLLENHNLFGLLDSLPRESVECFMAHASRRQDFLAYLLQQPLEEGLNAIMVILGGANQGHNAQAGLFEALMARADFWEVIFQENHLCQFMDKLKDKNRMEFSQSTKTQEGFWPYILQEGRLGHFIRGLEMGERRIELLEEAMTQDAFWVSTYRPYKISGELRHWPDGRNPGELMVAPIAFYHRDFGDSTHAAFLRAAELREDYWQFAFAHQDYFVKQLGENCREWAEEQATWVDQLQNMDSVPVRVVRELLGAQVMETNSALLNRQLGTGGSFTQSQGLALFLLAYNEGTLLQQLTRDIHIFNAWMPHIPAPYQQEILAQLLETDLENNLSYRLYEIFQLPTPNDDACDKIVEALASEARLPQSLHEDIDAYMERCKGGYQDYLATRRKQPEPAAIEAGGNAVELLQLVAERERQSLAREQELRGQLQQAQVTCDLLRGELSTKIQAIDELRAENKGLRTEVESLHQSVREEPVPSFVEGGSVDSEVTAMSSKDDVDGEKAQRYAQSRTASTAVAQRNIQRHQRQRDGLDILGKNTKDMPCVLL